MPDFGEWHSLKTFCWAEGLTPKLEAFATAMGWELDLDSDCILFDNWLELWPPQSQCFEGQVGWLACHVVVTPGIRTFSNGDPGYPDSADSVEIGEFTTMERGLAALARQWLQQQEDYDAEVAAYGDMVEG
jgi:hypothetical protein